MAAPTTFKHFFFLLLLLILSSAPIQARVNKFFSKFIHTDRNEVPQPTPSDLPLAPSPAPVPAVPEISPIFPPVEAPAPFFDESQNAYGLYGRDFDNGESSHSQTLTDVEEEILAEDSDESYKSGYPKTNLHSDSFGSSRRYEQYRNQNKYENSNEYRNSEYESNFENNDERNYQYQSNFEDNDYRRTRYESTERQGMSDTRFMENGRYFHDINSRNGKEGDSYGSKKNNKYEFDSMEEYENSEGFLP